jgi:hypothetical protein
MAFQTQISLSERYIRRDNWTRGQASPSVQRVTVETGGLVLALIGRMLETRNGAGLRHLVTLCVCVCVCACVRACACVCV